jgi:DNA repair exonuclease SbcCD ATPase subunit
VDLQTLEIQNFRGIKGTYTFESDGENAIIVGPNGSGKSSVLEAVNYLLTNTIRQLDRPGIGSVETDEIIRNVEADGDTVVSATF